MGIVYDKREGISFFPGKIYPSTDREFLSTYGNVDREGILGIFEEKWIPLFHKNKEAV